MPKKTNVLIVDDHPMIVESYIRVLEAFNLNNSDFELRIEFAYSIFSAISKIKNTSKENAFNLILLDISLPKCTKYQLNSGEEFGLYIKNRIPKVKIIVITSLNDNLRLLNILTKLQPKSFLIKSDITGSNLLLAVETVLNGNSYHSETINQLLYKRTTQNTILDQIDFKILSELSNGSKLKELLQLIPLTKSGIEKRKRALKQKFNAKSDRDLVMEAREKGFI